MLRQFESEFGQSNPVPLWVRGAIPRTGSLPDRSEYSIHGFGCTVERQGRLISFDFDKDGKYCYTAFKVGLFRDDEALDLGVLAQEFNALRRRKTLVSIPGRGVRLAAPIGA